ncbi:MAG: hypothetical protein UX39_C0013G0020 [Candidatus Magasanikbacteria bacterium GW2011_GWA2_46_17]|uniref:Sortilin N-terminal domain-containing protein n=1 Tax=Candidatus Magasanikbacteria bacterium GW2011_GWA2_46_17 TaxID=1619042 RepID=A0A0G1R7M7_9BACT|nr:MAG: hypothetical protein UX39_C0013G0020 [Candidatus Magasanikbacteria bacterium GW2011_GWA2_46_17]
MLILGAMVLLGAGCIKFGTTTRGPNGVFRSANKGDSWQSVSAYPTAQGVKSISGVKVFRIFTDPGDPNAFYLGTRGQGLFYSYDKGDSWQNVAAMNNKFIYGVAVDPRDKCTIYVTDGPNIFKTTDCSRTWQTVFTEARPEERFVSLSVDYGNSSLIYGAQLGGDIIRSLDAGRSWTTIKRFGFETRYMTVDPFTPERVYVASYRNGLWRSDDHGINWTDLSADFENFSESKNFYKLVLNPAQRGGLFWVSKFGILRSNDAGTSWQAMRLLTPPGSVNIYGFVINSRNQNEMYYTGTILSDEQQNIRSTFYRSTDGGTTWVTKKLPTNTIPVDMLVHKQEGGTLFLGFTDTQ